ncbi:MAG: hypothetical protein IPK60_21175 [Sandaracinaceae bacterium]|nr:hypothetical protein [Sandaracinaceae bacterium]
MKNSALANRLALLRRMERRTLLLLREICLGRGDSVRADELRERMLDDYSVDRSVNEKVANLAGDLNAVIDGDVEVAHGETPFGLREGVLAYAKKWKAAGFSRAARTFSGLAQARRIVEALDYEDRGWRARAVVYSRGAR